MVWAFCQANPGGFTLDIRTMTVPTEGIAVKAVGTIVRMAFITSIVRSYSQRTT